MEIMSLLSVFQLNKDLRVCDALAVSDNISSLLTLSQSSKEAGRVIDNDFFKILFAKLHPRLAKSPLVFHILQTFHPDKCWKVACWVLLNPSRQIRGISLMHEAPLQLPRLMAENAEEIGKICGSGFADPHSPMRKKFRAQERKRQRLMQCRMEILKDILIFMKKIDLFPNPAQTKWMLLHHDLLAMEVAFARDVEMLNFADQEGLAQCVRNCQKLIFNEPDGRYLKESYEMQDLQRSINSLSVSGEIWLQLYDTLAKRSFYMRAHGVQACRWSKNHFHHHLKSLGGVLQHLFDRVVFYRSMLERTEPIKKSDYRKTCADPQFLKWFPCDAEGLRSMQHAILISKRRFLEELMTQNYFGDPVSNPLRYMFYIWNGHQVQVGPAFGKNMIDRIETVIDIINIFNYTQTTSKFGF